MNLNLRTPAGTRISNFNFGNMQWGGKADATDSYAMYDLAHAAGINFFDTAHGHTGGASETLQGEFVAADRNNRFIATKCASPVTRITSPTMAKVGCIPQGSALGDAAKQLGISPITLAIA